MSAGTILLRLPCTNGAQLSARLSREEAGKLWWALGQELGELPPPREEPGDSFDEGEDEDDGD
jgi:hypothetical protein